MRKRVYIGHPLRGNHPEDDLRIVKNIVAATDVCVRIAKTEPGILILSPLHAFGFFSPKGDQTAPLAMCRELLSIADEARFYGDWRTSEGCMMEIEHARNLGIPVLFPEDDHGDSRI